jgi:hypothetical protein
VSFVSRVTSCRFLGKSKPRAVVNLLASPIFYIIQTEYITLQIRSRTYPDEVTVPWSQEILFVYCDISVPGSRRDAAKLQVGAFPKWEYIIWPSRARTHRGTDGGGSNWIRRNARLLLEVLWAVSRIDVKGSKLPPHLLVYMPYAHSKSPVLHSSAPNHISSSVLVISHISHSFSEPSYAQSTCVSLNLLS